MRKYMCWCLLFLTSCGIPPLATPPSTPILVNVVIPPSLRPYGEALHTCVETLPNLNISINEVLLSSSDIQVSDLVFTLGVPPKNVLAYPIIEESIVLIVNTTNPVLSISSGDLQKLLIGQITDWVELGGTRQSVQVWVLPEGDEVRKSFDKVIFPGENLSANALIAPNPQAMLEAINDDPLAIGYIPQIWLNQAGETQSIRVLSIETKLAERLRQPVLALALAGPNGLLRQLLFCLQSSGR